MRAETFGNYGKLFERAKVKFKRRNIRRFFNGRRGQTLQFNVEHVGKLLNMSNEIKTRNARVVGEFFLDPKQQTRNKSQNVHKQRRIHRIEERAFRTLTAWGAQKLICSMLDTIVFLARAL